VVYTAQRALSMFIGKTKWRKVASSDLGQKSLGATHCLRLSAALSGAVLSSPRPDGNGSPHSLHLNVWLSSRMRSAAPCSNPQCGQRQNRIGML
jgi:hypothetical protein